MFSQRHVAREKFPDADFGRRVLLFPPRLCKVSLVFVAQCLEESSDHQRVWCQHKQLRHSEGVNSLALLDQVGDHKIHNFLDLALIFTQVSTDVVCGDQSFTIFARS